MVEIFKGMFGFLIYAIIVFSLVFTCLTIYEKHREKEASKQNIEYGNSSDTFAMIEAIDLLPTSIIVIQVEPILSAVHKDCLIKYYRDNGINNKIIVMDGGASVSVLHPPMDSDVVGMPKFETKSTV